MLAPLQIVEFEPTLAKYFASLNMEWLHRYFTVEPVDREILDAPEEHIIRPGGAILFAKIGAEVVGTCALKPQSDAPKHFELTKMAVTAKYQGHGIGRALIARALARFRALEGRMLFLETNSRLAAALRLYERVGFEHRQRPHPSVYSRADVYMVYREADGRSAR